MADIQASPLDSALQLEGASGPLAALARSIYQQESGSGANTATSNAGAVGGMQILPATFKGVADAGWSIDNPVDNARAGIRYLGQMLDAAGGDPRLAAAGYYGGPGAITKAQNGVAVSDPRNPNAPTTLQYADQVVARLGKFADKVAAAVLPAAHADTLPAVLQNDPGWQILNGDTPNPADAPAAGAGPSVPASLANDPGWKILNGTVPKSNNDVTYQMPNGGDSVTLHYGAPPSAPARPTDMLDKLGNYVGIAVRGAINGFGSLTQPVVNELVALTNAGLGTHIPKASTNAFADYIGIPKATDTAGTIVEGTTNALSNPINYVGGEVFNGANKVGDLLQTGIKLKNPLLSSLQSTAQVAARSSAAGGLVGALSPDRDGQITIPSMIAGGIGGAVTGGALGPLAAAGGKLLFGGENRLMGALRPDAVPVANKLTDAMGIAESGAASTPKPRFKMSADGSITLIKPQPGTPSFDVPPVPQAESKLPIDVQKKNIEIMKEIGLDTQRPSAISGDKFTAGQEYQNAKLDTNMGAVWRNQLALEQSKIKDYARGLVQATGADAPSLEVAGQAIRAPLQGLSAHYDNAVNQLYKVADERAGGLAAVVPDTFGQLLRTTSEFAGKAENTALRRGINAYSREQGIIDKTGEVQPITVEQAEGLRQYLNSQWSPQNSGLIGKIKNALDTDVTQAGGDDIYTAARALHAERKNTLDNPNGIASLLNEKGPNGINQQVPDERVAAKIVTMPTNQLKHVVDTINGLPEELAPQGQKALAEIKAAFAKQIYKSGDSGGTQNGPSLWNAADVTRELNKLKSKMAIVFSPAELEKFQTLNAGGHLLQAPSAYPGAAVQGHNLLVRGMIYAPSAAGAGIGHLVGGIPGAFVGGAAGNALSRKVAEQAERAQANKLMEVLSSPRPIASK